MVKHIQTIRRQQPTNFLSVFNHFVELPLEELQTTLISIHDSLGTKICLPSYCNVIFHYNVLRSYYDAWILCKYAFYKDNI